METKTVTPRHHPRLKNVLYDLEKKMVVVSSYLRIFEPTHETPKS